MPHTIYPDGLPPPRRYWSMATTMMVIAICVLDVTMVSVALPSIARDFNESAASSIWIVNGYQLTILVGLIPLASLGEMIGYRRVSQAGLILFTIASLGCAFASSLVELTIARAIQGLGAAGIMSVNAALVRFTYPAQMLGRATGINAMVAAVATAAGPSVGAAMLAIADWRWLFAVNVPIGIIAAVIAQYSLPHTEPAQRSLSYVSVILHAATFGLLIAGLQSFVHEEARLGAALQITAAGAFGVLLVRREIHKQIPIVPFDLMRIPIFSLSLGISMCSFFAQMAAYVALPFELQRLGHSAVETGLLMTPWPVAVAFAAPIAGRLADRYPAAILSGCGLIVLCAGLAFVALFPEHGTAADLMWRMALCGLGFGFFQAPNNRTMMTSAPRARSGSAAGMLSTVRSLGHASGAALVAVLFSTHREGGAQIALFVAAAMAAIAAVLSFSRLRATGPGSG
ncbi:MAG TPA: MFS transporter [Steroidobacter sp.]|uniref:MFS transporter n=1 Tax=Steroidobacter sp. TaxID=1978227 RepID=UPI002ED87B3A